MSAKEAIYMSVAGGFIVPHPPIILPEVGKGEERAISATAKAYTEAANRIAILKPDTVILTSPHAELYADYFHIAPGLEASGDMSQFSAPQAKVKVKYDSEFVKALSEKAQSEGIRAGTLGERDPSLDHGSVIPLRFILPVYSDFRVVRIGLSGFSAREHYRLGECIADVARSLGRRTVIVASGDLSHKLKDDGPYGFAAEGPEFDEKITAAMADGDFMRFLDFDENFCDKAAECGLRSFIIMAGALDGMKVKPELLSYEGPFGVGYAVASFEVTGEDKERRFGEIYDVIQTEKAIARKASEDEYVRLARLSLETFINTGRRAELPDGLPEKMLSERCGAFVTLKKDGMLRGCIGTIEPASDCIAEEIMNNAVSAGTQDPRFDSVEKTELNELIYSVDVLSPARPVVDRNKLDARKYGVIVTAGYKRGLLLPDIEGVDTPDEQIAIALRKAGINKREKYTLEYFEVVRHK
jgi:AmmeMemoRadiSam system protein A/AmmeMemoRadiSam system protein B